MRSNALLIFSVAIGIGFNTGVCASGISPGDAIIGVFSAPVKSGNVANDPALGNTTFFDNTNTATVAANGGSLVWGSMAGGGSGTFSVLNFFGSTIPNANIDTVPFTLGTLTFSNGTSDLNSLIFGATLSFYNKSVSPGNLLATDNVIITTTSNLGTLSLDADYINICGSGSNICQTSIGAYESTEGGTGITATLSGVIVGDPVLTVTGVTLVGDGELGTLLPVAAVPEPSTWAMMILGFCGIGAMTYRRRKSAMLTASKTQNAETAFGRSFCLTLPLTAEQECACNVFCPSGFRLHDTADVSNCCNA